MLAASALALATVPAQSEELVGLTYSNPAGVQALIRFDSATPGVTISVNIAGLMANDLLIGIDRRPSDGLLYGISYNSQAFTGRIYTLDPFASANLHSTLFADPSDTTAPFPYQSMFGTGLNSGVDFNPVVDRLRVVSSSGTDLRINVDTGAVQLDALATYPVGDPGNPFQTPFGAIIGAVAYSNNFAGAATTVLTGVDGGRARIILSRSPTRTGLDREHRDHVPFFHSGVNIEYDISGLTGLSYLVGSGPTGEELYVSSSSGFVKVGAISASPFAIDVRGLAVRRFRNPRPTS